MIVSKYAFLDCVTLDGLRGADPARIAAQVVSGISFLGAGVIFKNGNSIRGLTTAAGMWGTAAIGMAVGAGMYWLGLFEAAVLVAIQIILHRFPVGADALTTQELLVELEDTDELRARFDDLLKEHRGEGLCSATIRFYERLARERGLDALYLTVNKRNEMAIRAYKAKGFEVIDAAETDIGDGYIMDDYIMEKKLV